MNRKALTNLLSNTFICFRPVLPKQYIKLFSVSQSFLRSRDSTSFSTCNSVATSTSIRLFSSATMSEHIIKSPYADIVVPNISLPQYLFNRMDDFKDRIAILDTDTEVRHTWTEIKNKSIQLASALTKLGYTNGDVICISMANCAEFSVIFLAVTSLGCVVTTANPLYHAEELKRQLVDSSAKAIFSHASLANVIKEASLGNTNIKHRITVGTADGCIDFNDLLKDDGKSFPNNVEINPESDLVVLPYSSGTTGLPKGVKLTHRNIVANILQFGEMKYMNSTDRCCAVLPFFHIYGLSVIQFSAFRDGSELYTMPRFDPVKFLNVLSKYKITVLYAVPPMVLMLAKHPAVLQYDLTHLRIIFSGAAPLGPDLTNELCSRLPTAQVIQGFGMTEMAAISHVDMPPCKVGSIGRLLCNTSAKVVDIETGKSLGPEEEGEVCVRGPQIMVGYLNNQTATEETIKPGGWLHTGDIGLYDSNGHFTIKDRLKELIKYKGYQVPPAELEALLLTHPDIQDAGVVGVKREDGEEVPRAFVVLKKDRNPTVEAIMKFVEDAVVFYKHLRGGVQFVAEIPKSASGKILRRKLKEICLDS